MAQSILGQRSMSRSSARITDRPADSPAFDRLVILMAAWHTAGVFLDGWAHQHVPTLETFFTPWHDVLYSGYAAVSAVIIIAAVRNWLKGYAMPNVLPRGYDLSLVGVVMFALAAVGDLIWHTLFGIEANVEALLSPTHLMLALGMTLILTGPVRAAYHRETDKPSWREFLPALLALTFTLSLFGFFTQYAHPFGETMAAASQRSSGSIYLLQSLGVMSILGQTALLMGFVLFALRRWSLPFGSLTVMFGVNAALIALMRDGAYTDNALATGAWPLIGIAVLAGVIGDLLIHLLSPSRARATLFHVTAFIIPFVLYALYFAAIELWGGGVWWSVHMRAGAIFLAGIVGLLLSYAMLPPPIEEVDR